MRKISLIILFVLITTVISACSAGTNQQAEIMGDPEEGRLVYENKQRIRCDHCHTMDGTDLRGGPSLLGISERAGERVPGMSAVEYLEQSLLEPNAYIVEGSEYEMKAYQVVDPQEVDFMLPGMLTQEEMDDLIAFLMTQ
jgi:cytochrome c2